MENAAEEDLRVDERDSPSKKRARRLCSAEGCTNYAKRGGLCIRHGGKPKACSVEGCTKRAQKGGLCMKHGAKVKRCSVEGCNNHVQKGGLCHSHGGKVKTCSVEGCTNYAVEGGVCVRHGAKKKLCSVNGCTKQAKGGGVCINHGAKQKRYGCSVDGCTNYAVKGGVCRSHRAEAKPCGSKGSASNAPEDGAGGHRGAGGREDSEEEGPAPAEGYDSDEQRAATCLIIMPESEGWAPAPILEFDSGAQVCQETTRFQRKADREQVAARRYRL